jgi:hypothetical protein
MGITLMQESVMHHSKWLADSAGVSEFSGMDRYIMKRHYGTKETPANKTGRRRYYGQNISANEKKKKKAEEEDMVADITSLSSVSTLSSDEED